MKMNMLTWQQQKTVFNTCFKPKLQAYINPNLKQLVNALKYRWRHRHIRELTFAFVFKPDDNNPKCYKYKSSLKVKLSLHF